MDYDRILCVQMYHPRDAETHNIPPGKQKVERLSVGIM
jgi:hypothetical protein